MNLRGAPIITTVTSERGVQVAAVSKDELGELGDDVAHRVHSPLSALLVFVELMRREAGRSEHDLGQLADIERCAREVESVADELEALNAADVVFSKVAVGTCLERLKAREASDLVWSAAKPSIDVKADEPLLVLALTSLLTQLRKDAPGTPRIVVGTQGSHAALDLDADVKNGAARFTLRLALAWRIIAAHGGQLVLGQSPRYRVLLPLFDASAEP